MLVNISKRNSGHQDLDKGYSELQELDFLWKDGNCYNQTMADPTPQVTDIPETLDTCSQGHGFGPFMSQSPGSLDYDDPSNGNDSVSPSNHSTNTYIDDGNITSPGSLPFSRTVPSEYDLSEETTSTPYTHTDNFTFLDIASPTKTSNGTGFSPSPMMQNSTFVKPICGIVFTY
ncbi:hypothetical protein SK128_007397 [Halocaridina rubra]|uniref:Uncharacterized protein n=1 Tax=Halocaridina rubra TaxID=373956 RepID=A0AAN8WZ43_HALRR